MRPNRINKLLVVLAVVALGFVGIAELHDRGATEQARQAKAQLEHVHRHLVAGCTVVEGEDVNTCEGRWLTVLSK